MRLGYVIVYVPDVAAAVAFYQRAFGLEPRFIHESGYAEMETGATALAFASEALIAKTLAQFRPNRPADPPAAVEIGLIVEDVAASFAHAVAAGAKPAAAPARKPWGQTVSYVRDLNGVLVEICDKVG